MSSVYAILKSTALESNMSLGGMWDCCLLSLAKLAYMQYTNL